MNEHRSFGICDDGRVCGNCWDVIKMEELNIVFPCSIKKKWKALSRSFIISPATYSLLISAREMEKKTWNCFDADKKEENLNFKLESTKNAPEHKGSITCWWVGLDTVDCKDSTISALVWSSRSLQLINFDSSLVLKKVSPSVFTPFSDRMPLYRRLRARDTTSLISMNDLSYFYCIQHTPKGAEGAWKMDSDSFAAALPRVARARAFVSFSAMNGGTEECKLIEIQSRWRNLLFVLARSLLSWFSDV